jgi:hypothetical protein
MVNACIVIVIPRSFQFAREVTPVTRVPKKKVDMNPGLSPQVFPSIDLLCDSQLTDSLNDQLQQIVTPKNRTPTVTNLFTHSKDARCIALDQRHKEKLNMEIDVVKARHRISQKSTMPTESEKTKARIRQCKPHHHGLVDADASQVEFLSNNFWPSTDPANAFDTRKPTVIQEAAISIANYLQRGACVRLR